VLLSADPNSGAGSGLALIDTRTFTARIVARGPIYGASFAPDGSDRIAYASAASLALTARINIHVVGPNGAGGISLTHDGHSLNPVWGRAAIAFDRERLRFGAAPIYQVWLMSAGGGHRREVTHLRVPPLLNGLVPIAFSDDGTRLLSEYEGQNTSAAWMISIPNGRVRKLSVGGGSVAGAAISRTGDAVLVDRGGFLNPPDQGSVISLSLLTGRPRVLVAHGSEPSWNL
jgi:hypothetical protein